MAGTVNKTDLVKLVAERSGVAGTDVDKTLKALEEVIAQRITKGDKVTIPGFLSFEQRPVPARTVRNPATGESMKKKAGKKAAVTIGSRLKAYGNGTVKAPK